LADPAAGEVRVACPEPIADGLLLAIIDRFSRQCPRVVVTVTAANNVTQDFRPLRDRTVDFLLAGFPKILADDDLELEFLYEDRPFVVSGRNSRWARRRVIELAELAGEPWLLPREGIFVSLMAEAFQTNGVSAPKLSVRTYSVHQRMMLLATDRFVSAEIGSVLRYNADRFPLKILPVNLVVRSWPVWIVTLKNRTVSPVVQTFLDCVRDVTKPMRTST
jgi:DNA-binding transcriptional LysR family regulator